MEITIIVFIIVHHILIYLLGYQLGRRAVIKRIHQKLQNKQSGGVNDSTQ